MTALENRSWFSRNSSWGIPCSVALGLAAVVFFLQLLF